MKESEEIPSKIQCDEGTEFQRIRNELSRKYSFEVFSTYNREIKASHAERIIQTLKTMVRRVLTVLSSNSSKEERNYTGFLTPDRSTLQRIAPSWTTRPTPDRRVFRYEKNKSKTSSTG